MTEKITPRERAIMAQNAAKAVAAYEKQQREKEEQAAK